MIQNKWALLTLGALTFIVVLALQTISITVLFPEIKAELGLTTVQIGWAWGATSLLSIGTSLFGGLLGDRFGSRRVLIWGCILAGLTGALRGLSYDFVSLAVTSLLFGLVPPIIPIVVHKFVGVWFKDQELSTANGIVSAGMALGFVLASALSATVLSPLLGGWQNVLFVLGIASIGFGGLWALTPEDPTTTEGTKSSGVAMASSLQQVARLPSVWLLGIASLGLNASAQGVLGYLPLYLREQGWTVAAADGAVSAFHLTSLVFAVPIALYAARTGQRRQVLMAGLVLIMVGIGALSLVSGLLVWGMVMLAGAGRDGFMATLMTTMTELKGVGGLLMGTAGGLVSVIMRAGMVFAPPLGNALAEFAPAYAFLFWAALAASGVGALYLIKDVK